MYLFQKSPWNLFVLNLPPQTIFDSLRVTLKLSNSHKEETIFVQGNFEQRERQLRAQKQKTTKQQQKTTKNVRCAFILLTSWKGNKRN